MRDLVLSSIRWMALTRALAQALTWIVTLIVIRLLTPDDYGLMAAASLFVSFAAVVQEMGLCAALIQRQEITEELTRKVYGLIFIFNLALFAILQVGAAGFAWAIGDARVEEVLRLLSCVVLIKAGATIPETLLTRAMNFRAIGLVRLVAVSLASLTTLVFAYLGYGVWSLVIGQLVGSSLTAMGFFWVAPYRRWPSFNFSGMNDVLSFGGRVLSAQFLYYIYTHAGVAIVGRTLGSTMLGYYSVAFHLATLPMSKVSGILNMVAFPAYSRIQDDLSQVRHYFMRTIGIICLIFFPICWGLSAVSGDFVELFLGEKWQPAAIILQLIALGVPLRMLAPLQSPVLEALGRPELSMRAAATNCTIIPICLLIGSHWGLVGVSFAWLIATPLAHIINLNRALPVLKLNFRQYMSCLTPAFVSATAMYAAVFGVQQLLLADMSATTRLVVCVPVGAIVYAVCTILINRTQVMFLVDMALSAAGRRRPHASPEPT